jgi:hypothetical protein
MREREKLGYEIGQKRGRKIEVKMFYVYVYDYEL